MTKRNVIKTKNDYWIDRFRRNKGIRKLNKRTLRELIKNIFITEDGNVRIVFNYQDEYLNTVNFLNSIGEKL